MDMRKILMISIIAVAVVASVSAVSAGFLDGLFGEESQDNVIEIGHITFNTTNVSEFKLCNRTEESGAYWEWYIDENDTGYNINILNCSILDDSKFNELLEDYEDEGDFDSMASQTINGTVVYTTSANAGDHIGDARYVAYVVDNDSKTFVDICSPDPNETAKIASTLKFL
jgi:hypothetical protein